MRSAQLTFGEYRWDEHHLNMINAQRLRDLRRNDGRLTPREARQLNRELNVNSQRIYFTKHNLQDQPGV